MKARVGKGGRLGTAALCTAWAAMLALGCGSILAGDLLAAPLAMQAKRGLAGLMAGDPVAADCGILVVYAGLVLFLPVAFLVGFTLVDAVASRGEARFRLREPAWAIQIVFLTIYNLVLVAIARFHYRPEPLVALDASDGFLPYWLKAVVLFLVAMIVSDVLIYWIHRAQHHFPWLWRFHAIHHSQRVDVLHNINHPLESVLNYVLVTIPVSLLIRVSPTDLLLVAALFAIQGQINHMRAPLNLGRLGWLLSDNRFHFVHHSCDPADFNTNFAARFPFIDRLFGTYNKPRETLPRTGLHDRGPPSSIGEYLLGMKAGGGRSLPTGVGDSVR